MYNITEEELKKAEQAFFISLDPLRIRDLPTKTKKRYLVLVILSRVFEMGRDYSEKEINVLLASVHDDYVTLRRDMVDHGILSRTKDGRKYWKNNLDN